MVNNFVFDDERRAGGVAILMCEKVRCVWNAVRISVMLYESEIYWITRSSLIRNWLLVPFLCVVVAVGGASPTLAHLLI